MTILLNVLILIALFAFLILGAELVMKGAVAIAKNFRISDIAIASTIIAFGTSLPSIAVAIALVLSGPNGSETAIGTAMGTNFVNIGLGLGIPAFLLTIVTKYEVFEKEIPIYLAITGLITSFALDGHVTRFEGMFVFLVYLFSLFIIYQYASREKLNKQDVEQVDVDTSTISVTKVHGINNLKASAYVVIGIAMLISTSIYLAMIAPRLSNDLGISEYILGLTVIGIGTSLPMIVTSTKSALKGYVDIVLGNVFGSTIANIALGIGLVAVIKPLVIDKETISDFYLFAILNIIVVFGILVEMKLLGNNKTLNKVSGIVIIVFYLGYLASKLI